MGRFSPLATLEKNLVYHPTSYPSELEGEPLPFEEARFQSDDGTELHGWFMDHPEPIAIALFCHGNAGNIASRGDSLMILNRHHRLAVMAFDYRGYGKSKGRPTENGILADARAARKWLAKRKGVREQDIVLMGRSLGGAVAIDLAAKDGAKGLVIASTFTSLPDVAQEAFPMLPARILMTQRFNSLAKIKDYHGPLLQSHGDADVLIPISLARELHAAAPGRKQFIPIPGGRHNDPQPEEYRIALDAFLRELSAPARRP